MPSIVFLSNYLTPHQKPICDCFFERCNGHFIFVATKPIAAERIALGYPNLNYEKYVIRAYEKADSEIINLVSSADYVISGSSPDRYITKRIRDDKITFKYQERLLKESLSWRNCFRFVLGTWFHHGRFSKRNLFLLCSSGFTAADVGRLGFYKNKCYKWGYFPELVRYEDVRQLIAQKKNTILWAGRLIWWKHPELFVEALRKLKQAGHPFHAKIIGTGPLENEIKKLIVKYDLQNTVEMLGPMSPESVRRQMEEAKIFVSTSDRNEGWGAVINEAMNAACITIAGSLCGAAPFLIRHKENGFIYKNQDADGLCEVMSQAIECNQGINENAYNTIADVWNCKNASESFIVLAESLKQGREIGLKDGPCSKAIPIRDDWF